MKLATLCLLLASSASLCAGLPGLKVADDHRHLVTEDGKPFFYLADTAWELFHKLTREEADLYLTTRAKQGFNVINAVALAEFDVSVPNACGELALENLDPARPNEAYFRHVDYMVDKAESLGMYTAFVPTWGDKWNKKWGAGPEIFTPENARAFGEWLGRRYGSKAIIWTLGADRPVETDHHREIIRAMAAGLKAGDGGRNLMTFHPNGRHNSSDYWPDEPWLNFHQFQSGHWGKVSYNFDYNAKNLVLKPLKPTLDGEPCYEDHPIRGISKEGEMPPLWFDQYNVRRAAWWNLLSGACGHVYGNHAVWQMYDGKREPVFFARTPWPKAIEYPGAVQMGVMRRFLEKLDWQKLQREDAMLINRDAANPAMAALATDKSFAVVYFPSGPVDGYTIDLRGLGAASQENLSILGYEPVSGKSLKLQIFGGNDDWQFRLVPSARAGAEPEKRDWLVVIRKKG